MLPEAVHPYDPLLDRFEPGTTTAQVSALFDRLRIGLVPLISEIAMRPARHATLAGDLPVAAQREIGMEIVKAMGFERRGWRLDDAVHPFAASPGRGDVRVTSRFDDHSLTGLFALMHEVGHGLYEEGVDPGAGAHDAGHRVSLGVHESQSRLWENLVGRSPAFWSYWLPRAARAPSARAARHRARRVHPRDQRRATDADPRRGRRGDVLAARDPALRARAGADRGTLDAADLPAAWASKIKQFLGIEVPDDLRGVLQDIHWSEGIIGYFPTYAIGNVLAAQLWRAARIDLPDLDAQLQRGELQALREWLRGKIQRHGRLLTPPELIEQAVGGPLDPAPMLEHLRAKYGDAVRPPAEPVRLEHAVDRARRRRLPRA